MADLPIAAIVCIAVGCYVAVIIGIIMLCYFLKGRGRCRESHCCAKDENSQSCECCIALAEACNCCKGPSLNSCLDSCCPNRKHISCADIIMCQCCASDGTTLCDCCKDPEEVNQDICNCCCLEIRLRSSTDKQTSDMKIPPISSGGKSKQAWVPDPNPLFRSIPNLQDAAGYGPYRQDLQLDLGWFSAAAYPISTHPINTNQSDASGDFVPTSTPRFHQGQSQLFIRPGVHSAGRVIANRQSGQWPSSRRWSSKRRSSRWSGSPPQQSRSPSRRKSSTLTSYLNRSPSRRRSSRATTNVRPISRRHSHREQVSHWEDEVL